MNAAILWHQLFEAKGNPDKPTVTVTYSLNSNPTVKLKHTFGEVSPEEYVAVFDVWAALEGLSFA